MAQKRMMSLEVIDTDAFLDMPQSCQLLYFHLNARADDDGFVSNPKRIMRDIGSQSDDLKLLSAKKFIISFSDGVCVIKHWRINNFIRKDIYKETKYLNWKQTLLIRPNGAYTQTDNGKALPIPKGHYTIDSVDEALTKRQPSIGKSSIDKDSKEKKREEEPKKENKFSTPSLKEIKDYCLERKNNVDPDNFLNFYESKGWLIGKNKMKDWRASVRTWENRGSEEKAITPPRIKKWECRK